MTPDSPGNVGLFDGDDGWRYHLGAHTAAERRRLWRFMARRSFWALCHHGWRGVMGMELVAAFAFGLSIGLYLYASGAPIGVAAATPVATTLLAAGILVPLGVGATMLLRWQMLSSPASRWVAHWCEGPDGQLGIRMTRAQPATDDSPELWPGRDLFGEDGAGRRLLLWLRHLADEHDTVVIIKTTHPELVTYYQRIGFTVTKPAPLTIGPAWQLGSTVLRHPPEQPGR